VSRKRKKAAYTPPPTAGGPAKKGPSPRWLAPLMLVLFGIGVLWLVVFYITQGDMPLAAGLGNANLLVGFGFIIAGFALSTQWR
jgi:hydrogenase-4 membrane subunit HyfE